MGKTSPYPVVTVVANNYLAQARVFAKSFLEHHPGGRAIVLFIDKLNGEFDPKEEPFEYFNVEVLRDRIPNFDGFLFQYSPTELATAVKPFFFEYLFEKFGFDRLLFCDPDIQFFKRLAPLYDSLNTHSITLIPHITSPMDENHNKPREEGILLSGTYNLGFIGIKNDAVTGRLLKWWKKRLERFCLIDPANGHFVDQRWMDLVPGFFKETEIIRDPGFDVAYWNLQERHIKVTPEGVLSNGEPLYFFHFSGYQPDFPGRISKHQDRFKMSEIGDAKKLFDGYARLLHENGYEEAEKFPYAFGFFSNGIKIPDIARKIYWDLDARAKHFGNPFDASGRKSFFRHLTYSPDGKSLPPVIKKMRDSRVDVKLTYRDIDGADRIPYLKWLAGEDAARSGFTRELLESTRFFRNLNIEERGEVRERNLYTFLQEVYDWLYVKPALRPFAQLVRPPLRRIAERVTNWRPLPHPFGVNVFGFFESEKGTGEGARSHVPVLEVAKIPYALCNVVDAWSENVDDSFSGQFSHAAPYGINLLHMNADTTEKFMRDHTHLFLDRSKYNIGLWIWELSKFPPQWLPAFRFLDEVWTQSNFALDSIAKSSPRPVVRIPPCVRLLSANKRLRKYGRDHFELAGNRFVFFFMFDFASITERKNPQGLIRAFKKAFRPRDRATLFVKCAHIQGHEAEFEELKRLAHGSDVRLVSEVWKRDEIVSLLSLIDCYISLHRSEGFGMTIAEAMALGKPVIATAYSGNMDFTTPANSYLVKYKLVELKRDYGPYLKGNVWAEPDIDHAAELMRHVYEHRDEAKKVGARAARDLEAGYGPEAAAPHYKQRLERIMSELAEKKGRIDRPFA